MLLCGFEVGLSQPFFLIAGPCVIESEQLQMDTAGTLNEMTRSLLDLATYAAFHLAGHHGDTPLLSQATMLKLHTAVPNNVSFLSGWT